MKNTDLQPIENVIGYEFSDKSLLAEAFTHSSAANNRLDSNERLEFLGDAILSLVICQALFEQFQDSLEGELTRIKSMLVSRGTCARVAKELELQEYLHVGKGMISSGTLPDSLGASLLEAVIAAIYIDGGLEAARKFILNNFAPIIKESEAEDAHGNYKSLLQQYAQERFNVTPVYILLDEKGPDHNKCFESGVIVANRHFPSAWGTNKKEAEQKAALNALVELQVLKKPRSDLKD